MTLALDPKTTALVLIDLQLGMVGRTVYPHSAEIVVANGAKLAQAFRTKGAPVVLVNVAFAADGKNMPKQFVDEPMVLGTLPPEWSKLTPEIGPEPGDILITKHNWSAFYGTALDLELRRRGVETIVLGGISTNAGVESTGRQAQEHHYGVVYAEDATASTMDAAAHEFAFTKTFPRIGKVRSTQEVLAALG